MQTIVMDNLDLEKLKTKRSKEIVSANEAAEENKILKAIKTFWRAISSGEKITNR